jgi:ATP-dependent 26S proteasome regulatory subunit
LWTRGIILTQFVRVDRNKYQIQIPLPPKIDASVTMMQVEEKPDVTYSDVGGCKEQIEKLREVVETPLLHVRSSNRVDFQYAHHEFSAREVCEAWN